jgi:hypothetical protein
MVLHRPMETARLTRQWNHFRVAVIHSQSAASPKWSLMLPITGHLARNNFLLAHGPPTIGSTTQGSATLIFQDSAKRDSCAPYQVPA